MYKKLLLIGLIPFWIGCASKPLVSYYDMSCEELIKKETLLQSEYKSDKNTAIVLEVLDVVTGDTASSVTTGTQSDVASGKQEIREVQQAIFRKKCNNKEGFNNEKKK